MSFFSKDVYIPKHAKPKHYSPRHANLAPQNERPNTIGMQPEGATA